MWLRRQLASPVEAVDVSASTEGKTGQFLNINLFCYGLEIKQFNINSERYYILHSRYILAQ